MKTLETILEFPLTLFCLNRPCMQCEQIGQKCSKSGINQNEIPDAWVTATSKFDDELLSHDSHGLKI